MAITGGEDNNDAGGPRRSNGCGQSLIRCAQRWLRSTFIASPGAGDDVGVKGDRRIEGTHGVREVDLDRQQLHIGGHRKYVCGLACSMPHFVARRISRSGTQHNGRNPIAATCEEWVGILTTVNHGHANPAPRDPRTMHFIGMDSQRYVRGHVQVPIGHRWGKHRRGHEVARLLDCHSL